MKTAQTNAGRLLTMESDEKARGEGIKARRLALGIKSVREFADAAGIDREALGNAEKGVGSPGTLDRAEAWLRRQEVENGYDEPSEVAPPIRLTFHDVYGVGEIIAEGPASHPDELAEAVAKIFRDLRGK